MKKWTNKGHPSELALQRWAAAEAEARERQAIESHLEHCSACRDQAAEWRELIQALAAMSSVAPAPSFDNAVMARVRVPAAPSAVRAWLPRLARRLRPVAVGAAALWTSAVIVGLAWAQNRLDLPAGVLLAELLVQTKRLALEAIIRAGTILHVTGLTGLWTRVSDGVPGPGIVVAVAFMTAMSGLALWTLYRVTAYQPPRIDSHA